MKKRGLLSLILMMIVVLTLGISAGAATYKWKSLKNGDKQCYRDGKLVKNAWVGDKHLNSSGLMDRNKWVKKKVNGVTKNVFVRNDGKYVPNFRGGWQKIGSKYYFYSPKGTLYKNKWITIKGKVTKKYYVNSKGYRLTGLVKQQAGYRYFGTDGVCRSGWQTINKKRYYFRKSDSLALTNGIHKLPDKKSYCFAKNGVMLTGWQKVNGKYYYFKNNMKTGWLTLSGKRYYLKSNGQRTTGLATIKNNIYYFDSKGVMQKNKTITSGGRKYTIDANGICRLIPDSKGPSDKMLFFLTFESGSAAYNQTGGDNGNACGAYQFDNRYSLLNFVKYAYSQDAKLCKEFKTYAAYKDGTKLKSNKKFYKAWNTIYKRSPKEFAALQDAFAKANYYDPVETALSSAGINMATRSDVVKGAVYSYSIQHGQTSAVNAVKAIKITSSTSDKTFLKKLYSYRIKQFPAYKTRYNQEYKLALSKL